ncbi:MAG: gephyrin-like molybdotransferase Glp [Bacteroidales bacterium]|nr:molybdopterin molybdotransferase MoeA [Bacteroidales bacterium]HPO66594.1 molybdopterin molybdotransferase MoeA [Bacteroidales bacterium]
MSKYEDILSMMQQVIAPVEREKVSLDRALNRVLREDIVADIDMPPFDKAAMDGYACRTCDLGNIMEVVERIPAGFVPTSTIGPNQCARIMTGAIVPQGADMVFMLEDTEEIDAKHVRCKNPNSKKNICYRGEDYRKGDILVPSGIKIRPMHIGILASAGYAEVWVSKRPSVAIMATGSELVEPYQLPTGAQIRNSNSPMLQALLAELSISANYEGIISDEMDIIRSKTEKALIQNDVLLLTGGASKGDFDYTVDVLQYFGFDMLCTTTGLQPGNPMIFAKKEKKFCFGLSGNPVSSFVQFELFVRPFFFWLCGCSELPQWQKAILKNDFSRKKAGRLGIVPVKFNADYSVETLDFHGSAHLNALVNAQALMQIPESVTSIKTGEQVYVRPL